MEKQWKNCGFDVWPLWGRSTEIKPWKKRANRLYGATVRIVGGAFEDLRSLLLHLSASPDAARQKLVHSWHHLSSIYSLSRSSLFLSFLFAPTFALPWLSFLPSQVLHNAQPHEKKTQVLGLSLFYHYPDLIMVFRWGGTDVTAAGRVAFHDDARQRPLARSSPRADGMFPVFPGPGGFTAGHLWRKS